MCDGGSGAAAEVEAEAAAATEAAGGFLRVPRRPLASLIHNSSSVTGG